MKENLSNLPKLTVYLYTHILYRPKAILYTIGNWKRHHSLALSIFFAPALATIVLFMLASNYKRNSILSVGVTGKIGNDSGKGAKRVRLSVKNVK